MLKIFKTKRISIIFFCMMLMVLLVIPCAAKKPSTSLLFQTVKVQASGISGAWSGTGVVVAKNKTESLVLTADHVCEAPKLTLFTVQRFDGTKLTAKPFVQSSKNDLCIMLVKGDAGRVAKVADKMPRVGRKIIHCGAPFGIWGKNVGVIIDGRFAGVYKRNGEHYTAFSLSIAPGSSGGGVFYRGRLFSIITKCDSRTCNLSFGIALGHMKSIISEAKAEWRHR